MDQPDPVRLFRNVENRRMQLDDQINRGTWQPTTETMTVILRHTLGILQALQIAVAVDVASSS